MPSGKRKSRSWFDPRYVHYESRRSYRLGFILFWSILLYFFFQHHVISVGVVTDESMLPALLEGNYFLINKYTYHFHKPERGDIVVLAESPYIEEQYVKRVVGLPGEELLIRGGQVYINGKPLIERYTVGNTFPDQGPLKLGPKSYFLIGDNREVSMDSRHFGAVEDSNIEGKIEPGKLFTFR